MCLTNIKKEKITRTRKVYKVLSAERECGSNSLRLRSLCNFFDWSRGVNESGRASNQLIGHEVYYKTVNDGFHIFKYKKDAINDESLGDGQIIVELTAKPEDYVASGLNNHESEGMVYTKLYISKAEYDKKVRKAWRAYEKEQTNYNSDLSNWSQ